MKCPACFNELTEFEFGGVTVDACAGGCAGIWFDAFELQKVDEHREVPAEHVLRVQRDPKLQVDFARRRDCPKCDGVKLKRHFFSAKKQVEVDHCPNCGGYWLDAGELEKIRAEKNSAAKAVEAAARDFPWKPSAFFIGKNWNNLRKPDRGNNSRLKKVETNPPPAGFE